jgi:hypothetical protein
MRMTKQQFDEAVDLLRLGRRANSELGSRVFASPPGSPSTVPTLETQRPLALPAIKEKPRAPQSFGETGGGGLGDMDDAIPFEPAFRTPCTLNHEHRPPRKGGGAQTSL